MAHGSHYEDETNHVRRHIDDNLKVQARGNRLFVPRHALKQYMTPSRTKILLDAHCGNSLKWGEVRNKYLAVFVILLSINRGPFLVHFLRSNQLSDASLPFQNKMDLPFNCRDFFEAFDEIQWEFCALEMQFDYLDDKDFDPRMVVPIVTEESLNSGDSTIWKVEVHPDYNCLLSTVRYPGTLVTQKIR
jgi:hypothetical protein